MSGHTDANVGQIGTSKALVVVSEPCAGQTSPAFMSEAGFLAQLIACKAGIGLYRRHRREDPGVASDRYRANFERSGPAGKTDHKTIKVA